MSPSLSAMSVPLSSHVIAYVDFVWHGSWINDEYYNVCDVYFCHKKWVWVGLWRPKDILWRFRNVMDQAIHDENLRNITRCNLWRSIHDAIWDHHRYWFMTVFSDFWRNLIVMDQQIFCSICEYCELHGFRGIYPQGEQKEASPGE